MPEDGSLQFQRAEFDEQSVRKCRMCQGDLGSSHFQIAGHDVCGACAERFQAANREGTNAELARATLFGIAGAAAGWALYGVVALATRAEFSLIAIACGWLVGRAMRKGANGAGGLRFQVVAVLLTYIAIATHYLFPVLATLAQAIGKPAAPGVELSAIRIAEGLGLSALYCLTIPFREVASVSGILGAVIVVIGLLQAWRSMRVHRVAVVAVERT